MSNIAIEKNVKKCDYFKTKIIHSDSITFVYSKCNKVYVVLSISNLPI